MYGGCLYIAQGALGCFGCYHQLIRGATITWVGSLSFSFIASPQINSQLVGKVNATQFLNSLGGYHARWSFTNLENSSIERAAAQIKYKSYTRLSLLAVGIRKCGGARFVDDLQ